MESTPIQNLPQSNQGEEDDSRIVQSILQEMSEQGGQQQNLPEQNSAPQMQVMSQGQQPQYMQPNVEQMPEYDADEMYDSYEDVQDFKKQSLVDTILKEVREPLVVILLYIGTNLPMLDKLITRYIPKTMTSSGGVNLIGTSLKAIVVAILFYIIKKFLC